MGSTQNAPPLNHNYVTLVPCFSFCFSSSAGFILVLEVAHGLITPDLFYCHLLASLRGLCFAGGDFHFGGVERGQGVRTLALSFQESISCLCLGVRLYLTAMTLLFLYQVVLI